MPLRTRHPSEGRPSQARARRIFRGRVAREGGEALLSDEWRAWAAENLLRGVARKDLVPTLSESGVPSGLAARELDAIARSPLLRGANRVARDLRRHALVTRLKRDVARIGSHPKDVERRDHLSREEFYDRYYAANTPVVVTDALLGWPALSRWSPSYFKERFGDVEVEITTGRDGDPTPDANFKDHLTTARLGEFCERVTVAGATNDIYLIANNRVTKRAPLEPLFDDLRAPHDYLDERRDGDCVSLWFGPAGTITPLHHDTANVLLCQVYGRKRVRMLPPSELSLTHDLHHGVYSPIDPERPNLEAYPELRGAQMKEVELSPGEGLFIPVGYWHHVRALEVSINLAFTNFRVRNRFEWYYPGMTE
jgi:hypothetical protein